MKYAEDLMKEIYPDDPDSSKGGSLLTCIAVTSLVGRLVCGKLADHPRVNRIFLQQGSYIQRQNATNFLQLTNFLGPNLQHLILIRLDSLKIGTWILPDQ